MQRNRALTGVVLGSLGLMAVVGIGCGPSIPANVDVFPQDGETVARNAGVWLNVDPPLVSVRDFSLSEVYNGQYLPVVVDAYEGDYLGDYIFCPRQTLSAWTSYYAEVRVGDQSFGWYFETDGSYDGDPTECYYVTGRGLTRSVGRR